ncbi:MAG: SGNH/GDSL hydrolase family protein [Chitinophagales bacterium]|nr:SGNH/GDSL hydrolase family protein [Chitinophagales bacterium]
MKPGNTITKALLILASVLLSLFIAEVALRWAMPDDNLYYVWQPNLQHTFYPDSTVFYGINGTKNFTINSNGYRGEKFRAETTNYLCLGGSTTECLYLDNSETWWALLEQNLNKNNAPQQYIFGSIGKSGITTRELYLHVKYIVPQLKYVNQLVIMPGLNDLMKRLSADSLFNENFQFTTEVEDSLVNTIFLRKGRSYEKTWWRKTVLFQLAQNLYHRIKPNGVDWMIQDDKGESLVQWRKNRKEATFMIDSLPDLTTALNEYKRNLKLICDEARRQGVGVFFVTQPVMYKDTMSAYEEGLLWMGGIGAYQKEKGHSYYSSKALKQGMEMYNTALREFCDSNNVNCIEAIHLFPRDTSVFYDDCHFNENGARLFAEYLASIKFQ